MRLQVKTSEYTSKNRNPASHSIPVFVTTGCHNNHTILSRNRITVSLIWTRPSWALSIIQAGLEEHNTLLLCTAPITPSSSAFQAPLTIHSFQQPPSLALSSNYQLAIVTEATDHPTQEPYSSDTPSTTSPSFLETPALYSTNQSNTTHHYRLTAASTFQPQL